MDEQPNVNNLNGVPNFGHGFPQDVPAEEVVADAGAPDGVDVLEGSGGDVTLTTTPPSTTEGMVEITSNEN